MRLAIPFILDIYCMWNDGDVEHKLCGDLKSSQTFITVVIYLAQLPWWCHLELFLY